MFHFAFCGYVRDVHGYAGNRIFWMAVEDTGFVLNATDNHRVQTTTRLWYFRHHSDNSAIGKSDVVWVRIADDTVKLLHK
jgi:hypothetical protein